MKVIGLAGLVALAIAGQIAHAQAVLWRSPVYANVVPPGDGSPVSTSFLVRGRITRMMRLTEVGTPGIAMAGKAVIGATDTYTPYLAKVSIDDGHVLWAWQLSNGSSVQGELVGLDVDAEGDIAVSGQLGGGYYDPDSRGPYLAKFNGKTGELIWQVVGDEHAYAHGVQVDAAGDVFAAYYAMNERILKVSKYSGLNGQLIWSSQLVRMDNIDNSFWLKLAALGNVVVGGVRDCGDDEPLCVSGAHVAKFRSSDGAELWSKDFPSDGAAVVGWNQSIWPIRSDSEDVFFDSMQWGTRVDGFGGQTLWWDNSRYRYRPTVLDVLSDEETSLFLTTYERESELSNTRVGAVTRIDGASGAVQWKRRFGNPSAPMYARYIIRGTNGRLLVAMNSSGGVDGFRVADLDPSTGALHWMTRFGLGELHGAIGSYLTGLEQASDGSIFAGIYDATLENPTWTIVKFKAPSEEGIFQDGYD